MKSHVGTSLLACCLAIAAATTAAAQTVGTCTTPLFGVGPINPVHGFPDYYQDSTGLALQPCLSVACDPAFALPNPNAPLSFPDNFPDEIFYSRAISTMTVGPMKVTYVAALEGAFANGPPVPGDQVVFARIRCRIVGATPGGTYTFTHPYGVDVVDLVSVENSHQVGGGTVMPIDELRAIRKVALRWSSRLMI